MSHTELHTGVLTKINTKGLTVEEYCEYICKKYGYEIAYEGDTYAKTLMDTDDTYKMLNGELYKCDDTQYSEDLQACSAFQGKKLIDWEQRRFEVAKEMFLSLYQESSCNSDETPTKYITRLAINTIRGADAFLAEYQKSITYNGK